jgi:hypothetical protein
MSYRPLIIKSEFRTFCKLGANVGKDSELDSFIQDMQELEFRSTMDEPFYIDVTGDLSNKPQLQSFLDTYIKPYLICGAYEKFLLWHGNNVSQFGIRNNIEDTSQQVSDKTKGELLADIKRKTNAYLSIMTRELYRSNYTFDGIVYTFFDDPYKTRSKRHIGIKQVGKKYKNINIDYQTGNRIGYDN